MFGYFLVPKHFLEFLHISIAICTGNMPKCPSELMSSGRHHMSSGRHQMSSGRHRMSSGRQQMSSGRHQMRWHQMSSGRHHMSSGRHATHAQCLLPRCLQTVRQGGLAECAKRSAAPACRGSVLNNGQALAQNPPSSFLLAQSPWPEFASSWMFLYPS